MDSPVSSLVSGRAPSATLEQLADSGYCRELAERLQKTSLVSRWRFGFDESSRTAAVLKAISTAVPPELQLPYVIAEKAIRRAEKLGADFDENFGMFDTALVAFAMATNFFTIPESVQQHLLAQAFVRIAAKQGGATIQQIEAAADKLDIQVDSLSFAYASDPDCQAASLAKLKQLQKQINDADWRTIAPALEQTKEITKLEDEIIGVDKQLIECAKRIRGLLADWTLLVEEYENAERREEQGLGSAAGSGLTRITILGQIASIKEQLHGLKQEEHNIIEKLQLFTAAFHKAVDYQNFFETFAEKMAKEEQHPNDLKHTFERYCLPLCRHQDALGLRDKLQTLYTLPPTDKPSQIHDDAFWSPYFRTTDQILQSMKKALTEGSPLLYYYLIHELAQYPHPDGSKPNYYDYFIDCVTAKAPSAGFQDFNCENYLVTLYQELNFKHKDLLISAIDDIRNTISL